MRMAEQEKRVGVRCGNSTFASLTFSSSATWQEVFTARGYTVLCHLRLVIVKVWSWPYS